MVDVLGEEPVGHAHLKKLDLWNSDFWHGQLNQIVAQRDALPV